MGVQDGDSSVQARLGDVIGDVLKIIVRQAQDDHVASCAGQRRGAAIGSEGAGAHCMAIFRNAMADAGGGG